MGTRLLPRLISMAFPFKKISAHGLDACRKHVTRPSFRAYHFTVVHLDLLPKAAHLNVDRAVVHFVVVQPGRFEQLFARQHALRRGEERHEQIELTVGDRHVLPRGDVRRRSRTFNSQPAKRKARVRAKPSATVSCARTRRSRARMRASSSRGENGFVR